MHAPPNDVEDKDEYVEDQPEDPEEEELSSFQVLEQAGCTEIVPGILEGLVEVLFPLRGVFIFQGSQFSNVENEGAYQTDDDVCRGKYTLIPWPMWIEDKKPVTEE